MEPRKRRACALLALLFLLLPVASRAEGPQAPGFEGLWAGVVIFQFAETEVDLVFRFDRQADATWRGTVTLPVQGMKDRPLQKVEVNGSDITFVKGPTETFVGKLSPDGTMITGEFTQDGEAYPFELERRSGNEPVPPLQQLSADSGELKRMFNADAGKVRLLLLMSPTCQCKIAARVVQRHVLEQIDDDRLRVYVVWEPIKKDDDRAAAVDDRSSGDPFLDRQPPTRRGTEGADRAGEVAGVGCLPALFSGHPLGRGGAAAVLVPAPARRCASRRTEVRRGQARERGSRAPGARCGSGSRGASMS
jgi:hypothetical protein